MVDPTSPLVAIPHAEKFLHTMHELMSLIRLPGLASPRAVLLFEDLLLRIQEAATAEQKHVLYQADRLNELIHKISAVPEGGWDFGREAKNLHVTPTHFRRIFKEITGVPPQQFLLHCRLNKAAELLKSTRASVKEIAAQSGWDNMLYFSRLFRQKYYISPIQYRKEFNS